VRASRRLTPQIESGEIFLAYVGVSVQRDIVLFGKFLGLYERRELDRFRPDRGSFFARLLSDVVRPGFLMLAGNDYEQCPLVFHYFFRTCRSSYCSSLAPRQDPLHLQLLQVDFRQIEQQFLHCLFLNRCSYLHAVGSHFGQGPYPASCNFPISLCMSPVRRVSQRTNPPASLTFAPAVFSSDESSTSSVQFAYALVVPDAG